MHSQPECLIHRDIKVQSSSPRKRAQECAQCPASFNPCEHALLLGSVPCAAMLYSLSPAQAVPRTCGR